MNGSENKCLELWNGVGDELWNVLGAPLTRTTLDAIVINFSLFNMNVIITRIF